MHPSSVQGVEDMTKLGDYHESAILRNILVRYREKLIYTYTGSILIAVNPYMDIPIYAAEQIHRRSYLSGELPPHIFAIADNAYSNMKKHRKNQSVVISGESGAGKTESTKLVLQFLATISGQHSWIEQQVLEANPILEAFGNAKTVRNDNSSRFGKYIDVHFNTVGSIEGARIEKYLLEKSRIVSQSQGERNYHIFYCLLAGLSAEEKKHLELTRASDFFYLTQGKSLEADGRDDAADLAEIRSAMRVLLFKEPEIGAIFQLLAALLHVGNVKYRGTVVDTIEGVEVSDAANVARIARLLQVSEQNLLSTLTTRTIVTREERVVMRLSSRAAVDARDALTKGIYGRLFDYIVMRINDAIYKPRNDPTHRHSIGVLDIFGFENFETNSFEQLCINYANETLQQFFVQHIFKIEQAEYDQEQINWRHIKFVDNQETLEMIAVRPMNLFSLIDEESIFPKGTDQSMLNKLHTTHSKGSLYLRPKSDLQRSFGVKHFAGPVYYHTKGFLEKNRDAFSADLHALVQSSKMHLLLRIFDNVEYENGTTRGKGVTVSGQFRKSLDQLMQQLNHTEPFFIRCIKPNEFKRALMMDRDLVLRQLQYSGMMETIKIRRNGYPIRHDFEPFVRRYRVLVNGIGAAHRIDARLAAEQICKQVLGANSEFQLGKTKVFLKEKHDLYLEQAACRGAIVRAKIRELKQKGESRIITKEETREEEVEEIKEEELVGQLFDFLPSDSRPETSADNESTTSDPLPIDIQTNNVIDVGDLEKYQFGKFAATYFQSQITATHSRKPLKSPLLSHEDPGTQLAAMAVWITILRFMGDMPDMKHTSSNGEIQDKTPVMSRLFETLGRKYSRKDVEEAAQADQFDAVGRTLKKSMGKKLISMTLKRKSKLSSISSSSSEHSSESSSSSSNALMENRPMSSLDKLHYIIGMGILREELRDEIYCQLCKQLTSNPSRLSAARGWILLSLCVGCFAPSSRFIKYLYCFIRERGPTGAGYSSYMEERLRRTEQNGCRHQPPSYIELQDKTPVMSRLFETLGRKYSRKDVEEAAQADQFDAVGRTLKKSMGKKLISMTLKRKSKLSSISSSSSEHSSESSSSSSNALMENRPMSSLDKLHYIIGMGILREELRDEIYCQLCKQLTSNPSRLSAARGWILLSLCVGCFAPSSRFIKYLYCFIRERGPTGAGYSSYMEERLRRTEQNGCRHQPPSYIELQFSKKNFLMLDRSCRTSICRKQRFYEATKFSGPPLPRNDVIVAVNWTGIYVVDDQEHVLLEFSFPEITRVSHNRGPRAGFDTCAIKTVTADEYSFQSPNAEDVKDLLTTFIEGLKQRSRYVVATKPQTGNGEQMALDILNNNQVVVIQTDGRPHTLEHFAAANFRPPTRPSSTQRSLMTLRRRDVAPIPRWRFSRDPQDVPLLKKLEEREEQCRDASSMFIFVMKYMGDQPSRRSRLGTDLTDNIFKPAIAHEILRDELYCQLLRQVTFNPSMLSEERGWELIWLATGLFAPSTSLMKEVVQFFKSRPHPIAHDCLARIMKMNKGCSRKFPPHLVEVEAIQQKTTQIFHKVYFPDQSDEAIEVESSTRARDFCHRIGHRLGLKKRDGFSLFVKIKDKVLAVPENEFFFDFVRQLSDWVQNNHALKEIPLIPVNYQVFFMRKLWMNVKPGEDKSADLIFHYHQECPKYLLGYHKIGKQEAIDNAALILRAITKDSKNAPLAQIPQLLSELVPKDMMKITSTNEWKKMISSAYVKVEHLTSDQAKIEFLTIMAKKETFGSAFFPVGFKCEKNMGKKMVSQYSDLSLPDKLLIAINQKGVHLYDAESKKLITEYPFNVICNWTSGNTYFNMTVGNGLRGSEGKKLLLDTTMGYKMDDLITSYISVLISGQTIRPNTWKHESVI
ncbi:hypothetical protein NECAME_12604 [Necator americanus]|uniref:Myosin head n=1 Tax=Necator americanus TaxID=51031 RepID=W2T043_NECAM|nr:hypothetical protein NECAME_12604 [Necator americanus]ETN74934.1 hypothetical protein NECAME_12604 [Necator americanus]